MKGDSPIDPAASETHPFGRYVLRSMLARGGMGEVFRAVAVGADGFEKPVVVKRILPTHAQSPRLAELFVAEAKLGSRLVHPNIVQVIDFARGADGSTFLVLEHVDGCDLRRLSQTFTERQQSIAIAVVLHIGVQVLRGLHHAHTRAGGLALVHRDVSPGNVLLSVVGEVKVADFGVALVAGAASEGPAVVAGKIAYMAPEQFAACEVDARADLFATGAMLFELLTGELPFKGEALAYRAAAHTGALRDVTELRSDVSPALAQALACALSPTPEGRYPDARTMARALEQCGERVASSDELADVVARVVGTAEPASRRIVRLGLGAAPDRWPEPADLERHGLERPLREATEIVRDRDGTFMMRATPTTAAAEVADDRAAAPLHVDVAELPARATLRLDAPGPHQGHAPPIPTGSEFAPSTDSDEPVAQPPRAPLWPWGLGLLALVAALAAVVGRLPSTDGPRTVDAATGTTPSPPPPSSAVAPPASTEPAGSTAAKVAAPSPPPTARALPTGVATLSATPAPAPTGSAPDAVCRGSIHLYASHAWHVSGGPGVVQAPGRYDWPCGSYALTAVSRTDPGDVRKRSVAVGIGAPAVVDLR